MMGELMEEMSLAVAVPFRIGNLICDNSKITHMEITSLKLITDTAATLLSDPLSKLPESMVDVNEGRSSSGPPQEADVGAMSLEENLRDGVDLFKMIPISNWVSSDAVIHECEEDDSLLIGTEKVLRSSSSLSVASDTSSICAEEFFTLEGACEISAVTSVDINKSMNDVQIISRVGLEEPSVGVSREDVNRPLDMLTTLGTEATISEGDNDLKTSTVVPQLPLDKRASGIGSQCVFELECIPLWGCISICGRRAEMEDDFTTVPRFLKIPVQLLTSDHVVDRMNQSLSHLTSHFFGVYDGHGGAQVANYCRSRMHSALIEEIENLKEGSEGYNGNWQGQWEKAFTGCFLKVDSEVGGKVSRGSFGSKVNASEGSTEPVAPETVGSTAVVAVLCSSHIIVANCGDSRAVLCRGKSSLPLSVDHKVSQTEKMNMQGLKPLEARLFNGMDTVCLVFSQCQGQLVIGI
ncbi:protein phosphatase 2C 7-like isoform X2 [Tasmannia lanceolata]|uniref:protein phosphatase 2C 7-like isoform X2 n=1 Tax=Tasmannia lanceolata TaxID=3420 RepID=UPI004063AE89